MMEPEPNRGFWAGAASAGHVVIFAFLALFVVAIFYAVLKGAHLWEIGVYAAVIAIVGFAASKAER